MGDGGVLQAGICGTEFRFICLKGAMGLGVSILWLPGI